MKVGTRCRALDALFREGGRAPVVLLTPAGGSPFSQKLAAEFAGHPRLVLICGHYEGG